MPIPRHIQSKTKVARFRQNRLRRKQDLIDELGEGTRRDPRAEIVSAISKIKSNIRIRKERRITVRTRKDGKGITIGKERYSHASSKAIGKGTFSKSVLLTVT